MKSLLPLSTTIKIAISTMIWPLLLWLLSATAAAQGTISDINNDEEESVRIIEPQKEVSTAKSAAIDDEHFELGLFAGMLAVEDFNSNVAQGISFTYHLTPKVAFQLNYGVSEVSRAAFEEEAGSSFVADDRLVSYQDLLVGYRVLRGRSFLGSRSKYNSDIYLLLGAGRFKFNGETETGATLGASYRVVLTDSLVANLDFRSHRVDREFQGDSKSTINNEFVFGLNVLF